MTQQNPTRGRGRQKSAVDIDEIVHELEAIDRQRKRRRKKGAMVFGGLAGMALLAIGTGAIIANGSGPVAGKNAGLTAAIEKDSSLPGPASSDAGPPQSPLTGLGVEAGLSATVTNGVAFAGASTASTALAPAPGTTGRSISGSSIGAISPDVEVDVESNTGSGGSSTSVNAVAGIQTGGSDNGNGGNGGNGGGGDNGGGGGDNGGSGGETEDNSLLSLTVGGNTVSVGGDDGLIDVDTNDDGVLSEVLGEDGLLGEGSLPGDAGGLPSAGLEIGGDAETGEGGIDIDVGGSADNGLVDIDLGLDASTGDADTDGASGGLLDLNLGDIGANLGSDGLELEGSPETEELIEIDLGGLF